MAKTIRTAQMTVQRTTLDADDANIFGEDGSLFGAADNIVIPDVIPNIDQVYGQIGNTNWWRRTVELSDFTFDNFMANQAPVALGPGIYEFEVLELTDLIIATVPQRIKHVIYGIILPGNSPFARANAADRSRPVVVKPTRYIEGGGESWVSHREGIEKPTLPAHTGATYALAYVDTEGDATNDPTYITRQPGQAPVIHLPLPRSG